MKRPGFHGITFGCQMNVNDSQGVARTLCARGFVDRPPWRGKGKEPAFAVFTAARIAEEKGVDAAALGRTHGAFSGWESPDSLR